MEYVTGVHALNLRCELDTCGDWHQSAIQWETPNTKDSDGSFFGSYGIETGHRIPEHDGEHCVANTIRALLDLLYDRRFSAAQGMNEDFVCNPKYDHEIFDKVSEMRDLPYWNEIDEFMNKEYRVKWLDYKEANHVQ